jgi:aspartate carbamoyltransferase regulatory subunit
MMGQQLAIGTIQHGTVIDHIPAGFGIRLITLMNFYQPDVSLTIALNLKSQRSGNKDLIKIEGRHLSELECEQLAALSPSITINYIADGTVLKKLTPKVPTQIKGILTCLNSNCITVGEMIASCFQIETRSTTYLMHCYYCEHVYSVNELIGDRDDNL